MNQIFKPEFLALDLLIETLAKNGIVVVDVSNSRDKLLVSCLKQKARALKPLLKESLLLYQTGFILVLYEDSKLNQPEVDSILQDMLSERS